MRMYVIVIVVVLLVLLVAGLLVLADRATEVVRRARKRRAAAERLAAAAARAQEKSRARDAAAEASGALTTVLPAILVEDHEPRHVALTSAALITAELSASVRHVIRGARASARAPRAAAAPSRRRPAVRARASVWH
jgi:hypothetical protein